MTSIVIPMLPQMNQSLSATLTILFEMMVIAIPTILSRNAVLRMLRKQSQCLYQYNRASTIILIAVIYFEVAVCIVKGIVRQNDIDSDFNSTDQPKVDEVCSPSFLPANIVEEFFLK